MLEEFWLSCVETAWWPLYVPDGGKQAEFFTAEWMAEAMEHHSGFNVRQHHNNMGLISCTEGKLSLKNAQAVEAWSEQTFFKGGDEVTCLKVYPGVSQSHFCSHGLQYYSCLLPLDFLWIALLKLWQADRQLLLIVTKVHLTARNALLRPWDQQQHIHSLDP